MPPITPMVRNLLLVNVLLYFLTGKLFSQELFSLHDFRSELFRPHQLVTHIFIHANFMHLLGNMFTLFMFGPMLERYWGEKRFLIFFLVTGIGASLLYSGIRYVEINQLQDMVSAYLQNPDPIDFKRLLDKAGANTQQMVDVLVKFNREPNNPEILAWSKTYAQSIPPAVLNGGLLGASGAVFGILMAYGMLFPNTELMLLFFPMPIKAKYVVFMFGAFELYTGINRVPGDNVAHFAHLGGMLFAYILLKIWERKRTNFY